MVLTAPAGKIPKDLSWAAGKKFMGNVDAFLKSLLSFDKDNVPVVCVDVVERDYMSNPGFRPDNIKSKSSAAAGLSAWVINICKYFRIYQVSAFCVCVGGVCMPVSCKVEQHYPWLAASPTLRRWLPPSAPRWQRPTSAWKVPTASWPAS